ncbi:hypothetical protein AB0D08_32620 [Kitasatospora sp. NPDC048540]|uniref:hypothetical protein n=1 Tax=Kitasatospora sp. NPDC048540 TaxID=3155634 RepID=UPI0033EC4FC4
MDHDLVTAPLSGIAAGDSRELDRVCEEVAGALIDHGIEPEFTVTSSDFAADPFLICADRYWRRRLLAGPTVEEAAACGRWLVAHVAAADRPTVTGKWASGYAFITRDTVQSDTELALAALQLTAEPDGSVVRFAALYQASKLQANFQFDALRRFIEGSPLMARCPAGDPLVAAYGAFAALGSRSSSTAYGIELLDRAWNAPDRSRQVTDICLHALWAARPFDDQGELLRARSEQALADHPDAHIFHFRLASGLRICERFDEALDAIDAALAQLPAIGSRGSHGLLQEQYLRERHTILDGRQRAVWATRQQHLWDQQDAANQELRSTLESSTVRAVELVAVFTAAIAFAVGSLQVTLSGQLGLGDRLWLLLALGGGLLAFSLLTVGGAWFLTRRRS